jgi:hypothetical protein
MGPPGPGPNTYLIQIWWRKSVWQTDDLNSFEKMQILNTYYLLKAYGI